MPTPLEEALARALGERETPVAAAADALLAAARGSGASDVHLDPESDGLAVLYRVDGVLLPAGRVAADVAPRLVARLKVLAELPTYVTDLPQEGRIRDGRGPGGEWRLATFPTVRGERAVLRAFGPARAVRPLGDLGLPADVAAALADYARHPRGALVLCGPAGSGKTTTIYALLAAIRDSGRHVLTLEDPVECEVPGVTQTQVAPAQGLTFARGLRSLLRQDPDVLMVGEVRDRETAAVAVEAALTGHPLVTTVHGDSAPGALARLLDLDVEPASLTSAVVGVVSQRLLRRACRRCRGPACPTCGGTGYRGRLAVADWVGMSAPLRKTLLAGADEPALAAAAAEAGSRGLDARAADLVAAGETTTDETERVLGRRAGGE